MADKHTPEELAAAQREDFEAWLMTQSFDIYSPEVVGLRAWSAASRGKQELLDALRETAQSLAWLSFGECRGFSDNLLTSNQAMEMARALLKKHGA